MTTAVLDEPKAVATQTDETASDKGGKYLAFKLAQEEYGIEILKVREINDVADITAVPGMPRAMKGVIHLRSKVIPVIDLRLQFGLEEIGYTERTCIIVADAGQEIGFIVDAVSEVLDIPGGTIEPPPSTGAPLNSAFILGMAQVGDVTKILLDIDKVLTTDEVAKVVSAATPAGASMVA
jgi:purine-binding chemotaxis protein CheW